MYDPLKHAMERMNELREKFTYRTVMNLGEFDWVVIKEMLNSAYSVQFLKVKNYEFKISVMKEDEQDVSWAEYELINEKVRLAAWKQAMNNLLNNLESESLGFGWEKNMGNFNSRNLYEGYYGR